MINHYTREAGVRSLEREIGSICRKVARQVLREGGEFAVTVDGATVRQYLGKPKFRMHRLSEQSEIGVATGLAWTEVGERSFIPRWHSLAARGTSL